MLPETELDQRWGPRDHSAGHVPRMPRWTAALDRLLGEAEPGSQARDQSRWNWWLIREGDNMCPGRVCGQGQDNGVPTLGMVDSPLWAMQLTGSHRAVRE